MITLSRIERTALARGWHRLLDEVLSNGRPVDLPIRLRLSGEESVHLVSAALALQRVCELSYALSPLARALADDLLHAQADDGSFGSVASTAVAVRALLDLRAMPGAEELAMRLDFAIQYALRVLAESQDDHGLLASSEIDSAVALWQLGGRAEFAAAVRLDDLREALCGSRWQCLAPRAEARSGE